jgi:hypothetical protein
MTASVASCVLLALLIGVLPALFFFWFPPPRQKDNDAAAVAATETTQDSESVHSAQSGLIQQPRVDLTQWKCACTTGSFLPPGLLKSVAGQAEATLRMGTGQCYHQQ